MTLRLTRVAIAIAVGLVVGLAFALHGGDSAAHVDVLAPRGAEPYGAAFGTIDPKDSPPPTALGPVTQSTQVVPPSEEQVATASQIAARDDQVQRYVELAGTNAWNSEDPWYTEQADGSYRLQGLVFVLEIPGAPLVSDTWRVVNYPGTGDDGLRTAPAAGSSYEVVTTNRTIEHLAAIQIHVDLNKKTVVGLSPTVSAAQRLAPQASGASDIPRSGS